MGGMHIIAILAHHLGWTVDDGPKEKIAQVSSALLICNIHTALNSMLSSFWILKQICYWNTSAWKLKSVKKSSVYLIIHCHVSANKDGLIYTLPALLDNYTPNLDRLPLFLLCLAVEVHYIINYAFPI